MLSPNQRWNVGLVGLAIVAVAALAYILAILFGWGGTSAGDAVSFLLAPAAVVAYWGYRNVGPRLRHGSDRRLETIALGGDVGSTRYERPRAPSRSEYLARPLYDLGGWQAWPGGTSLSPSPAPPWLEAQAKTWKAGNLVWDPPGSMRLGRARTIEVVLGTQDVDELCRQMNARTATVVEKVKIGELMRVRMIGEAFDIKEQSEPDQPTFSAMPTRWSFSVTPKQKGRQELSVRVAIRMRNGQQQEIYDVDVLRSDVEVLVGWGTQLGAFLKAYAYPVAVAVATLIGVIVKYVLDLTTMKTWIEGLLAPLLAWLKSVLGF